MSIDVVTLLGEGDKRTVKHVAQVVQRLQADSGLLPIVVGCLDSQREGLALRAADSLEKASRPQPAMLQPYSDTLIRVLQQHPQKELRWHLAQMLPRLRLSLDQLHIATRIWIDDFYHSPSSIVRTASLQAMHDIQAVYPPAAPIVKRMLAVALESGTKAMQARARHLLQAR